MNSNRYFNRVHTFTILLKSSKEITLIVSSGNLQKCESLIIVYVHQILTGPSQKEFNSLSDDFIKTK